MRRAITSFIVVATLSLPVGASAQFSFPGIPKSVIDRINNATTTKQVTDAIKTLPATGQAAVIRSLRIDPRIVGGFGVDIGEVPWQVALIRGYAPEPMRSQFCGGTLVAPDVVLTAAHCVDNSIVRKDATRLHVVSGTAFYAAGGDRVSITAINIHPQWDSSTMAFDFAILKLARATSAGTPIPIQAASPGPGTVGRVSGWGARAEGGQGTPDLLAVDLPVVDRSTCNAADSYGGAITSSMLCAGVREGGLDSCQGDSGGPFVAGVPSAPRLMGVVSWGEGCGRQLKYGIYADVANVVSWIRSFSPQIAVADEPSGIRLASRK
jgi:trypsin